MVYETIVSSIYLPRTVTSLTKVSYSASDNKISAMIARAWTVKKETFDFIKTPLGDFKQVFGECVSKMGR